MYPKIETPSACLIWQVWELLVWKPDVNLVKRFPELQPFWEQSWDKIYVVRWAKMHPLGSSAALGTPLTRSQEAGAVVTGMEEEPSVALCPWSRVVTVTSAPVSCWRTPGFCSEGLSSKEWEPKPGILKMQRSSKGRLDLGWVFFKISEKKKFF